MMILDRIKDSLSFITSQAKINGCSPISILIDFIKLKRNLPDLSKTEYANFQLFKATSNFRKAFLPYGLAKRYWEILNPYKNACLARNKYMSHLLLDSANIPQPKLIVYYNPEIGQETDICKNSLTGILNALKLSQKEKIVIKPSADSAHGYGVIVAHKIKYIENDAILSRYNGDTILLSKVLDTNNKQNEAFLIEEQVNQNDQMNCFNSSSVNTIRIMTALYPNREVKIIAAFIKIGREGADVDNAGSGGNIDCGVDIRTGKLYNSIEFNFWTNIANIKKHPDNNTPLEGTEIKGWKEILCQLKSFQARLPQLKTIGWDVAITPKGPIIIEINNWWDTTGQLFINKGWHKEVKDCFTAWTTK